MMGRGRKRSGVEYSLNEGRHRKEKSEEGKEELGLREKDENKSNLREDQRAQQSQIVETSSPLSFTSSHDSIPIAASLHTYSAHKHNLNTKSVMEQILWCVCVCRWHIWMK